MKSQAAALVGLIVSGFALPALADTVVLPHVGAVDSRCVSDVPKGAHVDGRTGDVWLNGTRIRWGAESIPGVACPPPVVSRASPGAPATYMGWEEDVQADAVNIDGTAAYSGMSAIWETPNDPINNDNGSLSFVFPSIEQLSGSSVQGIVQPVTAWNNAGSNHTWQIFGMAGPDANGKYHRSPNETISAEDEISGTVTLEPNGEWLINVQDTTSGAWTLFYWTPVFSTPYNYAQAAVLEAYSSVDESNSPGSCSDLPGGDGAGVSFTILYVNQIGANDVSQSWTGHTIDGKPTSCYWQQTVGTWSSGTYQGDTWAFLEW